MQATSHPPPNMQMASSGHSDRDWTIAVILAVFLGYFGAHRFYEGRIILGIILLLTGGGFIVGWVVDAIIVLMGKSQDDKGLYVTRH